MNYLHLPSSLRSTAATWNFPLGIDGYRYADLNRVRRLMGLFQAFRDEVRAVDPALSERYEQGCNQYARREGLEDTALLIDVARHLDAFIARMFHIETEVNALNRRSTDDRTVYEFKRRFLDRLVLKSPPPVDELAAMNIADVEFRYRERVAAILTRGEWANDPEREMAEVVVTLLDRQAKAKTAGDAAESARCEESLRDVLAWARVLAFRPELKHRRGQFASFVHPEKLDFENLVAREFNDPQTPRHYSRAQPTDGGIATVLASPTCAWRPAKPSARCTTASSAIRATRIPAPRDCAKPTAPPRKTRSASS